MRAICFSIFRRTLSFAVAVGTAAMFFNSVVETSIAQIPSLQLTQVASGLSNPLYATSAPGDPNRLFIAEQGGNIRILNLSTGTLNSTPFLTAAQLGSGTGLTTGGERGLLGLAFDPNYQTNRRFYVNYTDSSGNTNVRSFQSQSGNADLADGASAASILQIAQPFSNHNGGWMDFGPDGHLYIGTGDGGSGNDPGNRALDRSQLLGKMLRITPNTTSAGGYTSPNSNPFVNDGNVNTRDEIWAYGLRNPWRNSFDRLTGDLYIADVGQGSFEEINFQRANSAGGENYGWRVREGANNTGLNAGPLTGLATPTDPIHDYVHGSNAFEGFSVTGGFVYRGPVTGLQGQYFFADYVSQRLFSLQFNGNLAGPFNATNFVNLIDWNNKVTFANGIGSIGSVTSFGQDLNGNLYMMNSLGQIHRFTLGAIPEPGTGLLLLVGTGLLATARRRKA